MLPLLVVDARSAAIHEHVSQWVGQDEILLAPTLWTYEIASTLNKLHYFGQIDDTELRSALQLVELFEIRLVQPDHALTNRALSWAKKLRRVSAYDCFYLAVAEVYQGTLWTTDLRLVNAVREPWVRTIETAQE